MEMETEWNWAVTQFNYNPLGWSILLGVLLILAMAYLPYWGNTGESFVSPKVRGKKMLRRQRRNYVRSMIIDELVNIIELRVFNNEISRAEAKELYRDARKYWPVKDLFPAPQLLKENVQKRLASKTHEPVPLVDKKPKR